MLQLIRHRSRRWSWIAALAFFGLAIAPTLSRALMPSQNPSGIAAWLEICSAGTSTNDSQGAPSTGVGAGHLLEHCSLCGLTAAPALPPSPQAQVPLPDLAEHRPALFLQSTRPLFTWATAQPRAPPQGA